MKDHINTQKLLLAILVVVSIVWVASVFLSALDCQAICIDDSMYLVGNPLVQNPSLESIKSFVSEVFEPSTVAGYYQPVTMISLMYDCAFGGSAENLTPFHRTSIALHIANVTLLIIIMYMLFGRPWIALAVGLVFGLHPMTVETIVWVSERKTVLSSFFALSSLLLYLNYTRSNNYKFYIACLTTYILGALSKPTVIPLPAVMLLIDFWPLGRINRKALQEKIPLFALGGLFLVITFISQSRSASTTLPDAASFWEAPALICHNIVFYFSKILYPANLTCHYPMPAEIDMTGIPVLMGFIGTGVILILLLLSLRWTKGPVTAFLIFFVAILPTMHIVGFTNVIAANKFVYFPSIGLLTGLASLVVWLGKTRHMRRILIVAILGILVAEGYATRSYLGKWQETIAHYEYMLQVTPNAVGVRNNLGLELMMRRRFADATKHFQKALSISPDSTITHYNYARVLRAQGKFEPAIEHYHQAINISPDNALAMNDLAITFKSMNKLDEAIQWLKKALENNPKSGMIHNNVAMAYAEKGLPQDSLKHFEESVKLQPTSVQALNNTAWILATHPDEQIRDGKRALHYASKAAMLTNYQDVQALDILAATCAENGEYESAVKIAQRGLDLVSTVKDRIAATGIHKRLNLYKQQSPYRANISRIIYAPGN